MTSKCRIICTDGYLAECNRARSRPAAVRRPFPLPPTKVTAAGLMEVASALTTKMVAALLPFFGGLPSSESSYNWAVSQLTAATLWQTSRVSRFGGAEKL
jgi:hypothetical protein